MSSANTNCNNQFRHVLSMYKYIYIYIYIQGVQKNTRNLIVNSCLRFQDTSFYFVSFEKGSFKFFILCIVWAFRETHRVKGCNKNVSLFLIVRRKMALPSDLTQVKNSFGSTFNNLNSLDFYLLGYMRDQIREKFLLRSVKLMKKTRRSSRHRRFQLSHTKLYRSQRRIIYKVNRFMYNFFLNLSFHLVLVLFTYHEYQKCHSHLKSYIFSRTPKLDYLPAYYQKQANFFIATFDVMCFTKRSKQCNK